MAHFDYTRVGGNWGGSTTVTVAEFESLDSKTERAINGDEGGAWAPTDPIVIGGDGMEVTGDFTASGVSILSDCQGVTLTSGAIEIQSATEITVQSGGTIQVDSGGEILVEGGLVIDGTGEQIVQAGGLITVEGAIEAQSGGTIELQSGSIFTANAGSGMLLAGTVHATGTLTHSGSGGRTVWRVAATATNANSTPDVSADIWPVVISDGNAYTATCDVTSPAPTTGERLVVRKIGTSGTLTVNSEGPIPICVIGPGEAGCAELYFDGTQWRLIAKWDSSYSGIFSGA